MGILNNFSADDFKSMSIYTPIPDGFYKAIITESDWADAANNNGRYIKIKYVITEGEYAGRYVYERLHLQNQNEKAVYIANSKLADICRAVDKIKINDTYELHNKELMIKIVVRPGSGNYQASNDVFSHAAVKKEVKEVSDDDIPF